MFTSTPAEKILLFLVGLYLVFYGCWFESPIWMVVGLVVIVQHTHRAFHGTDQ